MNTKQYLEKTIYVKIDRPLGSTHPKFNNLIYPINYGFVPNTINEDGEELDCYILGVYEPLKEYTGKCIAIIQRLNDNDDKLIIVPEDKNIHDPSVLYFILDDPLAIRDLNFYYRDKKYLNASTKHFLKQFD